MLLKPFFHYQDETIIAAAGLIVDLATGFLLITCRLERQVPSELEAGAPLEQW
jgi:hypothetical protein